MVKPTDNSGKYRPDVTQKYTPEQKEARKKALLPRVQKRAGGVESSFGGEFDRLLSKRFGGSGELSSMDDYLKSQMKLGIYSKAATKSINNENDIILPATITPKVEKPIPNADVSTLVKQMDVLLQAAQNISKAFVDQQKIAIQKIKHASRVTKEAQLESKDPNEQAEIISNEEDYTEKLKPLNSVLEDLAKTTRRLIDIIKEKIKEKCDCENVGLPNAMGSGGGNLPIPGNTNKTPTTKVRAGSLSRQDRLKAIPANKMSLLKRVQRRAGGVEGTNSGEFDRLLNKRFGGSGRLSSMDDYLKTRRRAGGGGMAGMRSSPNTLVPKPSQAQSSITRNPIIAGKIQTGDTKRISSSDISRNAEGNISKAVGTQAIKSIPAAEGINSTRAAERLVNGDVISSGIDITSGLGLPLTTMPALVASQSRDTYMSLYGRAPEQDPNSGPKLDAISETISKMLQNQLSSKIVPGGEQATKEQAPTPSSMPTNTGAAPSDTQSSQSTSSSPSSAPTSTNPTQPGPSPTAAAGSGQPGSGATTSGSAVGSMSETATSGTATTSQAGKEEKAGSAAIEIEKPPTMAPPKDLPTDTDVAAQIQTKTKAMSLGTSLIEKSLDVDMKGAMTPTVIPIGGGSRRVMPSSKVTTKNGAKGMGDVPDPSYNPGSIANQLYFTAIT